MQRLAELIDRGTFGRWWEGRFLGVLPRDLNRGAKVILACVILRDPAPGEGQPFGMGFGCGGTPRRSCIVWLGLRIYSFTSISWIIPTSS